MESRQNKQAERCGAFFDLDRTLIHVNSGMLFVKCEYRNGRISRFHLLKALGFMALYHLSLLNLERAYAKMIRVYQGVPADRVERYTWDWFDREVAHRLLPGAKATLEQHRRLGHPIVLLTNSSGWVADAAVRTWGLEHGIANRFPTDQNGNLLGVFESPLCYGAGKIERAEQYSQQRGIDLDQSYFYTDSYSDLPMLERVGNPRVVNPDPRLKWVAKKRKWPILDWRGLSQNS